MSSVKKSRKNKIIQIKFMKSVVNYTFHKFNVLKRIIISETFNVNFPNKFIEFRLFWFFYFLYAVRFNFLIYFYKEQ